MQNAFGKLFYTPSHNGARAKIRRQCSSKGRRRAITRSRRPLFKKWRGAQHAGRGEYQDRRAMSYACEPAGRLRQNALGARVSRSVLEPFLEPSAISASHAVCITSCLCSIRAVLCLIRSYSYQSGIFCIFIPRCFTCVPQGSRLDQLERRRRDTAPSRAG